MLIFNILHFRTAPSGASHVWGVDEGLPLSELTHYLAMLEKDLKSPTLWYHYQNPTNVQVSYCLLLCIVTTIYAASLYCYEH